MSEATDSIAIGDEVVIAGGVYAGERARVVARDGDTLTVELSIHGASTKMAFDVTALTVPSDDPRARYRSELERHYQSCAREDMIHWFSQREGGESLEDTDELACLYQIASPIRREYLRVTEEFDAVMSDRAVMDRRLDELAKLWESRKADWFARLTPPSLDAEARARALALMDRVRAAMPSSEDLSIDRDAN